MRAKFPKGVGMWPAFWMLEGNGTTPGWEVDILEWWGMNREIEYNVHNWYYDPTGGKHVEKGASYNPNVDVTAEFHTYGMEWSSNNTFRFYFDGKLAATIQPAFAIGKTIPSMPVCLVLQNGGIQSTTPLPGYYDVDWVRIYAQGTTAIPVGMNSTRTAGEMRISLEQNRLRNFAPGPFQARLLEMNGSIIGATSGNRTSLIGLPRVGSCIVVVNYRNVTLSKILAR